jgi:hypothetical protein
MAEGNSLLDTLAHPTVVNPLAAFQGAAQTANSIWEIRAHQARQAAGEAYQQATDPVTGEVDPAKAQAIMAAMGPRASLAAQSSATSGQALKSANLGFNQQQQVGIGRALAGVLSMPDAQQTPENYKAALDFSLANHSLDQAHYDNATRALGAAGSDPAALRAFGTRIFAGTLAGPEVAGFVMPAAGGIDQGPTYQPTVITPASQGGGARPAGAPIRVGLPTAAQKIQPVSAPPGPLGAPRSESLGSSLTRQGLDANGDPIANPAFSGLPPALRGPNQPAPTPVITGVSPAESSAMSAGGTASSATYQGVSDAATKAVGRRALLQSMASDATQFTTGWGADRIKNAQMFAQRIAPTWSKAFGLDPDKLAANQDLDKVANQLADAQGAGSDARLSVTQGANPTSHNTPEGLRLILGKLTGNEDYNIFKGQAAAQYQKTQDPTGAHSRAFEAQFRDAYDPRVFQFNRLDGAQQRQYLNELGAGKDAFKRDFMKTKAAGVLPGG